MSKLFQWLKETLGGAVTEHDNKTHNLYKHGGWVGLVAVFAHDAYLLHSGQVVPVRDFALAIMMVLGGSGAGVLMGKGSEHNEVNGASEEGGGQ